MSGRGRFLRFALTQIACQQAPSATTGLWHAICEFGSATRSGPGMKDHSTLSGKIGVVTGAAGGIGRASAIRLAKDGASVALLDIDGAGLQETASAVRALGRQCEPVQVDLLDADAIKGAFTHIKSAMGPVDILHNNAGQSSRERSKAFWESEEDQWRFILDLNLMASVRCAREVAGDMRARKSGRIINTASEFAYKGGHGTTDYTTSKSGVLGFTRSLALELAPYGVTVNCVCPGVTRTKAVEQIPDDILQPVIDGIAMKTIGEPEDIAHAVAFFASPGAWYVTGTHLLVNGGHILI